MNDWACPSCGARASEFDVACPRCGASLPQPAPGVATPVPVAAGLVMGTSVGDYVIESVLSRGGFAIVYRARHLRSGRLVALKVLSEVLAADPDARTRFLREARALRALDHVNVGALEDVGDHGGTPFLALCLYEGVTLEQLLLGTLDVTRAARILAQVARGLAAAHAGGILHRDLKPANVLVNGDDGVKVLDFGLAKILSISARSALTMKGAWLGTAAYSSPEQICGENADHRADLWSLGVVAYEALTGQHPFRQATLMATATRVLGHAPPAVRALRPDVPAALEELVAALLMRPLEARWASATDAAVVLDAVSADRQLQTP